VDLIDPQTVQIHGQAYEIDASTCLLVDPVTNLAKIIQIKEKSSEHIIWIACYLYPEKLVHDNGGDFLGWQFQLLPDLI
jgi:hypothetical protein